VAVAAVKYSFLKQGVDKDLSFDFDESVSFEGNSGPYLQYTYARCKSVLSKSSSSNPPAGGPITNDQLNQEELAVLRAIYRYPEVIAEAAKNFNPSLICTYLYDLACTYNTFYNKHSILKAGTQIDFRLMLTAATAQVLKNGLNLLGIKTVEKM
jgi:arginyl-tRNA synthetase